MLRPRYHLRLPRALRGLRRPLAAAGALARRSPAALIALLVLLVAAPVLALAHHRLRQPLPARVAIHDALRNDAVVRGLAGSHWNSARVSGLDGQLERVSFFVGARTVVEVAVRPDGTIDQVQALARERVPFGDWVAYEPAVLAGLSAVFILALGVVPLRRRRNFDVLALLSLLLTVILFQRGYLRASALAVLPGLGYLAVRCAARGLGAGAPAVESTPLLEWVTQGWDDRQRARLLRVLLTALALVFAMVGVSSPGALDVAYGVMEGATTIVHGLLPYGHMPGDVIHGDTYPILSYVLYVPLAWVAPVNSIFSSVDGALALAVAAALAIAGALYRTAAGPRIRAGGRAPGAEVAGLRSALAWLSFPPLLIIVSTGTTDLLLAAMLAFAVLLWRRPAASMALLAVGGWFKLAPFALVPVWLAPLRGARLASALCALAAVSAATIGLVLALGGIHAPAAMAHALAYQFDRGSLQSPWSALGIASWQPVGQAVVLALVAGAAVRLARDPELAHDRARMAALSVAILLALQLAANFWTFLYLAWIIPLVGVSLLTEDATVSALAPARVPVAARIPGVAVAGR